VEVNTRVRALEYLIQQKAIPGIVETVPSFRSLLVYYDPLVVGYEPLRSSLHRLALYARRDELEIMQLVGAPQAFIRGPFVMEGVLQGGVGALLALAALGVTFLALRGRYLTPLASAMNMTSIHFLPLELCIMLVVGGMAVGCVGGLVAAWGR